MTEYPGCITSIDGQSNRESTANKAQAQAQGQACQAQLVPYTNASPRLSLHACTAIVICCSAALLCWDWLGWAGTGTGRSLRARVYCYWPTLRLRLGGRRLGSFRG